MDGPPSALQIGPCTVSEHGSVWVIAEAGVNHNGDPQRALALIDAAKAAGADAIKFQTFRADRVVTTSAPKAAYQQLTTHTQESQLQMLRKLELPHEHYPQLLDRCREKQIVFLSTPYQLEDADFLESLGVPAYKVASGQAVEPVFLEYIARKGKPVLLSTGMCTLQEVEQAVSTIRQAGNTQILTLQCTTDYPSAVGDANLRAMVTMRHRLGTLVGYSDHTPSLTASVAAVALGACVIERHLTLDRSLPGPDHACSCDPDQFATLVQMIRETQQALGASVKAPTPAEQRNMPNIRRGVVAQTTIPAGTPLTLENLTVKRPLTQLGGTQLREIIGRTAMIDIPPDTPITPEMIR